MKANLQDQQTLLKLAAKDAELARVGNEQQALSKDDSLSKLSEQQLELSEQLIVARNAVADLELALKRAENDLELVENRIAKDKDRIKQLSSPKDIQGIEHELASLATRKSELEDSELEVMSQLESAQAVAEELKTSQDELKAEIAKQEEDLSNKVVELKALAQQLSTDRSLLLGTLSPDLVGVYEAKAKRGIAVGKLMGRDCGVCRLGITASILDEILALPADELAECPSCGALLVR